MIDCTTLIRADGRQLKTAHRKTWSEVDGFELATFSWVDHDIGRLIIRGNAFGITRASAFSRSINLPSWRERLWVHFGERFRSHLLSLNQLKTDELLTSKSIHSTILKNRKDRHHFQIMLRTFIYLALLCLLLSLSWNCRNWMKYDI